VRLHGLHVVVLTRAVAPLHGVGGLERHGEDLIRHLLDEGVRVTLVTQPPTAPAAGGTPPLVHPHLSVRYVPYVRLPFGGRRGTTAIDRSTAYPVFGWRAGQVAAALVRQGGIHVVHGMGAASLGFAHERRKDWYGTVPFVFNPHGMEEFGSTGPGLGTFKQIAYAPLRQAVRACARSADRVIATDRALVPAVVSHLGVSQSRVAVVPNAVDLARIDAVAGADSAQRLRERIGLSPSDPLLLSVGRLERNKGFHDLVAALAKLEAHEPGTVGGKWRSVVVGDGPYRPNLERDVRAAGLADRILFPGRVSDADLHAWYEAATLFVHPTLYEGSSIVTLEAMSHRLPIVATSAGGLPDKVRPGVNGWLVAPGDVDALARSIREGLDQPARLATMRRRSREMVEQEFAWGAVIQRVRALYDEVLSGRATV
jgi:glycosyltransferase involved in cell wall biosynthesis